MGRFLGGVLAILTAMHTNAQQTQGNTPQNIEVGSQLVVGPPTGQLYKHIDFPRPNFIIKRGGVANYKRIKGTQVLVVELKSKKDGTQWCRIKRTDGRRFFGSHKWVMASVKSALASGELLID